MRLGRAGAVAASIPGALALGRKTPGPEPAAEPHGRIAVLVVAEPNPLPAMLAGLTEPCLAAVWLVLARRARQRRSSPSLAPMRRLVDTAFEGLLIHDAVRIVEVHAVFARLIGLPAAELPGRDIYACISEEGRELAPSHVQRRSDAPYEIDFLRSDGSRFPALLRGHSVADATGRSLRVVAVRDLTEQRRNGARLHELAFRDPLTGLANRDSFHLQLDKALLSAQRSGSTVALLCVDMDRFKELNEVVGARIADRALCDLGALLAENLRERDTVARLSADQFAVVLHSVDRPDDADDLARQLIEALRLRAGSGTTPPFQISIGIALAPQDGADTELLLRRAEVACRRAKDAGGAAVRSFAPVMDAQLRERRDLELRLHAALAEERLEVHFQPPARASSREILGFEALLRWTDPELGPIPPDRLIPLAEERGLIGALGRFVLDRACRVAADWPAPRFVAVNLSPLQFLEGDLVGDVARAVAAAGLPAERLELKITEGSCCAVRSGSSGSCRRSRRAACGSSSTISAPATHRSATCRASRSTS